MEYRNTHLTQVALHLDHLSHNMAFLQKLAGRRLLFPAIKANAYGHGAEIIARHLIGLGYSTLCTAHLSEAAELVERGVEANFIILSPTLAQNSEYLVHYGFEPCVCSLEQMRSLAEAGRKANKQVKIHVKVDTGMGRVGLDPNGLLPFLEACKRYPQIVIGGICSHFPRADESDLSFSHLQLELFTSLREQTRQCKVSLYHFANSAAIFNLPEAHFDAVRPGIAIYGLKPSVDISTPEATQLQPVLSLTSRITHLKEVPEGTGISYGHTYTTDRSSLIATIPVGYGDGISRSLSNRLEVLVGGGRCRQVGRICMDQCMVDVTRLRGTVLLGDEVVIIGTQGKETLTADDLARQLDTINYEIVTALSQRVPRIVVA